MYSYYWPLVSCRSVLQQAGDEIVLLKRIDDDWYIGRLGDQEGMFPVKFVEIIEDLPQEKEPETKVPNPKVFVYI